MTLSLPALPYVNDYLQHHARQTPEASACWFDGVFTSYAELEAQVDRLARALHGRGLRAGDRLAVLSTPRPEFWVSLLAALRIGAVWVGLNPRFTLREWAHVVGDAQPRMLLSLARVEGQEASDLLPALRLACPGLEWAFRLEAGPAAGGLRAAAELLAWAERSDVTGFAAQCGAVTGDSPGAIVYTSGSSGAPKGAVLPQRSLVYGPRVAAQQYGVVNPRVICNLPIDHVACLGDICCSTLVAGGLLVFDERFDPGRYLALIERLQVTHIAHVPTVLQLLRAHPDFDQRDLSSVELAAWGGAALPIDDIRAFRSRGWRLFTAYGLTETVCNVTWADGSLSDELLATTVGRPDPGLEVRLVDEQLQDVADGQDGEIVVRHEALMLGYFNQASATAAARTPDGYLRTGDVARRLPDGSLQLVGRRSEMFKSGGYNVYPREVELCLEQHPCVAAAAVVAVPDTLYQEVGMAWLVARPGCSLPDEAQLRDWCRQQLAPYKIPKRLVWRASLPLLPVGKVDKRVLKEEARALMAG